MTASPTHPPAAFAPPPNGDAIEVAPGILWLRFPLPFRLNHVNLYLVEDGPGWLLIDTGGGDPPSIALWSELLEGGRAAVLRGRPITRILVTHHHPDHVGAASFLAERTGAPLLMPEIEYLTALSLAGGDAEELTAVRTAFYRQNGVGLDLLAQMHGHLGRYRALVPALPATFQPLRVGDRIVAGSRVLDVLEVAGHASAQALLHAAADNILFAADHVLTRITPNISVSDRSPTDDPLGRYLASLSRLRATVPDGGLVLPGHHLPFRHLHERTREIAAHHDERCDAIAAACADKGRTAAELVPVLFPFALDPHQFWFGFSEILAHLNTMAATGRLERRRSHGTWRWGQPGRSSHTTS